MDVLIYLIPLTILFGIIGLAALIWAIRNKQYNDLKGAAERILFDDKKDE